MSHGANLQVALTVVNFILFADVNAIFKDNAMAVKANKTGCRMEELPETVDWCNQPLDTFRRLPENTICETLFARESSVVLVCSKSRWVEVTSMAKNRAGRSLGPVLTLEFNRTCLLFCDGENITDAISRPPNFTQCPASVTLYPERGSTEVTYTWTEPIAIDWDGNLTVVQKIFGANSTSSFESYVSPGTRHMISYLATDLDNKNWTCAFTITAEIPTCPPIVHLENGFLHCTDDNLRASVCEFSCYHGYQLNATSTVECQDNGTWSGQGVPQCLPVVCDGNINSTLTDSRLNVVCEKTVTGVFGDVCWLTCHDNFRLRNDLLGAHILYTLNNSLTLAEQAYENASIEAERSRNDTLEANMNSTLLASLLEAVKNTTKSLEIEFQNVTQMVNAASAQLSQLVQQFNKTRADLDLTDNHTEINDLKNNISDLERRLDEKNITLNNLLFEMTTTEHELNETRMKESVASEKAFKAKEIARVKELAAMAAKSTLVVAASELDAAREAYENASVYVTSGLRTVATDVTCNSSGVWQVQGQPYCEDVTAPSLKCVPVYTFYLDPNQTVGIVTWPEPEVDDNSNSATVRHVSGPSPGEILTSGRHVVKYEAVDNVNNTSPVCTVVINVKEVVCEDLGQVIGQSTISYTCDSFELGTTCSLACDSRDVIDGPDHVTCMLDFETGFPFWNWENTTCLSENCSQPAAPIHGYISCFYEDILVTNVTDGNVTAGNVTSNRTEETFVCEFSCAEGYMLPYATLNRYTCSGNDVWNSEFFPATCIETGAELSTQHSFLLTYDITSCDLDEIHELATDWKNVVSEELPSFSDCMSGFLCDMGDVSYQCNADNTSVTVTFSVHVSCEEVFATALPLEATCDLTENKMASLLTSQEGSSSIRLFIKNRLPAAADLFADNVTVPECPGSVLIGAYCARCPAGSFYARSLDRCILCPVGSYTETPGRDFCTSCPQDQATLQAGSVQPHECRDICRAGSYSYTTVAPCSPCPTGTYQGHVASVACSPCPAGTWTQSEGSTSLADCIAYDLYFDDDVADILLTSVGQEFSVVLWTSSIAVTSLTLGVFGDSGEPLFILRARSNSSNLYFDSWDSEPVNLDLVSDMWTMLGVTWSAESRDVHLYQDVKHVYSIQIQASEPATQLRISAGNQTFVSGLSISNRTANSAILSSVYSTCGTSLPAEVISLDHVAAQRLPHVNVAASSCQAGKGKPAQDHCGLHTCFNGGECTTHVAGYTCTCPETHGGPTCEEELIHGGWSDWVYDGACSRTCGHGTRLRFRSCDSPPRSMYGKACPGNSTEVTPCFMRECPECEAPIIDGIGQCGLHDDLCEASCPLGYILPRGQQKQTFQCGQSTNFTWNPFQRLPICSPSFRPESYSVTMMIEYASPLPCSGVAMAIEEVTTVVKGLRCSKESASCSTDVKLSGCADARRKRETRSTSLGIVLSIPLSLTGDFNLPLYYETGKVTDTLLEAMTALNVLESTVRDVKSDLHVFSVTIDMVKYNVANFTVSAHTHCGAGFVPVEAVCAQCQKGTYMVVDKCRYCPVGQYQNATGQNACVPCPSNQATWTVGSRDSTECFVPPPSPLQEDTAWILIVAVAGGAGFLVMVMTLCVARYLYVSGRDRKRYDLEVDEISLYTDFPDLSYNTFFKRRQVVGFDSDGFPVVKNFRSHNGDVKHSIDAQEDSEDEESVSSELQMSPTRDHLAYPEPEGSETPFSYDPCRAAWNDNYVIPYEYPVMEQWDFPKIGHPMRYRIPGRTHLQNIYPLQQFGLMGEFCSRTRKEPPLPENLPVSNKLPQLMHRPEEKLSMKQIFKQAFGITSPHEEEHEQMIEINAKRALLGMPQMPPLPFKNKPSEPKFEHPPSKPLLDPKPFLWTRPARGQHVIDKGPDDYDRQEMALTKKILPAIRTASVLTPKSVNDLTNSPYRTTVRKSSDKPVINGATQSKRNNSSNQEYTKQIPHTKDPTSASTPIDAIILGRQSENVPSGRKSVTIHENFTPRKRPLTPLSIRRPSFSNSSASDISNTSTSNLPYSTNTKTSVDAVKTIPLRPVAYLPSDATDTYQPVSVTKRSLTPLNIPKPILHPEVAAKRTVPARPLAYLPSDAADTHQPMLAAGYTSQPMSVSADTSQPMSVSADTSQPMSVSADNSQPMPIVADSSQPMSVVADTYQSMSVVADTYQTMSVALSPVTEDTYQHISVTKRSLTPVEHPKPVLHPGVAVKRTVPARPLAYLPSDVVDTSRPMSIVAEKSQQKSVVSDIYEPMSFVPDTNLPMSIARLQVAADTYQPISVTKRSITPLAHPQPVLHPGVAVKRTAYHTPSTPNEPLKCIRPPSSFRYSLVPTPTFVNEQDFAARRRRDIESRVSYDMDGGIETLVGGQGFTMTSQPPESTAQPGRKGYLRP